MKKDETLANEVEIFCADCGTEEIPDVMGNFPNCGKYLKEENDMLDAIISGFIGAVEFAESEDGESVAEDSMAVVKDICENFYSNNKLLIDTYAMNVSYSSIGHDFWLTMQGHGTGFWDRGINEDMEKQLTEISQKYHLHSYIEDGKIFLDSWKI